MARLIDADALMDSFRSYMVERYDSNKCTLEENCKTCQPGCLWRKKVMAAPTVDAVEVVHGMWEERRFICMDSEVMLGYRCSKCMLTFDAETNYCPNCGAKMDGGDEDG